MSDHQPELYKHLKHNVFVNLLDGAFFGLAIGFASFVTVLPLFVRTMTASAVLIGLIPAIHSVGWQLPQLFTAGRVARQRRYKPLALLMTLNERLPYLGLALVAWSLVELPQGGALALTFALLVWQGFGGGLTANAWQSLIGKIIPPRRRGTFYGAQAAVANLLAALGAALAGFILDRMDFPSDFALCFFIAFLAMVGSWVGLALTREPEHLPASPDPNSRGFWSDLGTILRRERRFRWFLVGRTLSQLAVMASAFYTVYLVGQHNVSELEVSWMTSVYMGSQIVINPLLGWLGDRWSNRAVMEIGLVAAALSALLAWWAPSGSWFYAVFILTGIAGVGIWTIGLSMVLEFGELNQRPVYIGMANTLVAPANLLAPLLGGWLANIAGYPAAFLVSACGGLAAALVFHFGVRDK